MRARWDQIAYVARYGNQPHSEIVRLTLPQLRQFQEALDRLVREENRPKK